MSSVHTDICIVGGGIAAVACAQHVRALCRRLDVDVAPPTVAVVSASAVVKAAANVTPIGRAMVHMDVREQDATDALPGITFVQSAVTDWSADDRTVSTADGRRIHYATAMCIATGARPKVPQSSLLGDTSHVVTIRDTDSVQRLCGRLATVTRLLLVGNGGIATELLYALDGIDVVWSIKHSSISASFIDAGAAQFFADRLDTSHDCASGARVSTVSKSMRYGVTGRTGSGSGGGTSDASASGGGRAGAALGPHWVDDAIGQASGALHSHGRRVHVVPGTELQRILQPGEGCHWPIATLPASFQQRSDWPVRALLTDGSVYECDLVLLATGVVPNSEMWTSKCDGLQTAGDGGISVNDQFESSVPGTFAIGDVCTCSWQPAPHWIQMRLWTQAQQHAVHAAECMVERHLALHEHGTASRVDMPVSFEIFTHVTHFFGYKVILLGRFNGQGLPADTEALLRVTRGEEYIKVLLHDGRVQGAILIGDTDLEETMENLILNQTDVSTIKDGLLDPTVDIEDYFD